MFGLFVPLLGLFIPLLGGFVPLFGLFVPLLELSVPLFALYRGTPRADGARAAVVHQPAESPVPRRYPYPPACLRRTLYACAAARVAGLYASSTTRWRLPAGLAMMCTLPRLPPPPPRASSWACACCVAIMRRARVATVRPTVCPQRRGRGGLSSARAGRVECANKQTVRNVTFGPRY